MPPLEDALDVKGSKSRVREGGRVFGAAGAYLAEAGGAWIPPFPPPPHSPDGGSLHPSYLHCPQGPDKGGGAASARPATSPASRETVLPLLTQEQPPAPRDEVLSLRRKGPRKQLCPGAGLCLPSRCPAAAGLPLCYVGGSYRTACPPGNINIKGSNSSDRLGGLPLHPGVSGGTSPLLPPWGENHLCLPATGFGDKEPCLRPSPAPPSPRQAADCTNS